MRKIILFLFLTTFGYSTPAQSMEVTDSRDLESFVLECLAEEYCPAVEIISPCSNVQSPSEDCIDKNWWNTFMLPTSQPSLDNPYIASNRQALHRLSTEAYSFIQKIINNKNTNDPFNSLLCKYSNTLLIGISKFQGQDNQMYLRQSQALRNILSSLGNLLEHALFKNPNYSVCPEFYTIVGQASVVAIRAQSEKEHDLQEKNTKKNSTSSCCTLPVLTQQYIQSLPIVTTPNDDSWRLTVLGIQALGIVSPLVKKISTPEDRSKNERLLAFFEEMRNSVTLNKIQDGILLRSWLSSIAAELESNHPMVSIKELYPIIGKICIIADRTKDTVVATESNKETNPIASELPSSECILF